MSDETVTVKRLSSGASVRLVDDEDLGPEAIAMLQALYSRSDASVEQHLSEVLANGSAKFMQSFYVGYNHKSIADCGSTTLFFENVSLLAAKAIQDWPLYSGQETSTRFLNMSERPLVDPIGSAASAERMASWMSFYEKAVAAVPDEVRRKYPRRENEPESKYEAAVKARTFDICRGFLPAGITTQLSWHSNLHQLHDHLAWLRRHPLYEVRDLAEAALSVLAERYPSSGFNSTAGAGVSGVTEGQSDRDRWLDDVADLYAYDPDLHEPIMNDRSIAIANYSVPRLDKYKILLESRPRGAVLPHFVSDAGQVRLQFDLDFGSFRDIQRHRNGVCRMPLIEGRLGFESWYIDELPESLREKARALVRTSRDQPLTRNLIEAQYYRPLGERVRCDLTYSLPALLYVLEIRSQKHVHPTLRRRVLEVASQVRDLLPQYVRMHLDLDPNDWDLRRGQQDIHRVG